jgi:hypothetical protein
VPRSQRARGAQSIVTEAVMVPRRAAWLLLLLTLLPMLAIGLRGVYAGQKRSFDKLSDADRKLLGDRFKQEVWPLLERGGKDGCVGCHSGKIVSALKFSGDPDKDFRVLLRDGFFLKDDQGSLLERIEDRNLKRRMPPPKNGSAWTDAEKKPLRELVDAIDQKQAR